MLDKNRSRNEKELLVHTCLEGEVDTVQMTRAEYAQLDRTDVDFDCDEAFGRYYIRKRSGQILDYSVSLPGLGKVGWRLLFELMWRRGEMLSRCQIVSVTGNKSFRGQNCISTSLARFRRTFGETARKPWYFLTRRCPFAIAWHADRTWRIIEWIAQPTNGEE